MWNVTDQALSSITNAGAVLAAAAVLDADDFGHVAIALTVSTVLLQLLRPVFAQPLLLTAGSGAREATVLARAATGTALALGVCAGVVVAAVGLTLGGPSGEVLAAAAVVLPGLFVQDTMRFVAFAGGRPRRAAISDAIWLAGLLAVLVWLGGGGSIGLYVLAWGGPAGLAGLGALVHARVLPDVAAAGAWTRRHRAVSGDLFVEIAASVGSIQAAVLVVGGVLGAAAAGAFRATQTLLGPVNVLGMAGVSFLVPELVRRPGLSARQRLGAAAGLSGVLAVANVCCGLVLLALPDQWGELLLGDTWANARQLLVPLTLWSACVAFTLGPFVVLQALGRTRTAARCALVLVPLVTLATAVGLAVDGARGVAFGFAAAQLLALLAWWPALVRAIRARAVSVDGGEQLAERDDLVP